MNGITPTVSLPEIEFRAWKLSLPLKGDRSTPNASMLEKFFRKALHLVDANSRAQEDTITALASEGGLQRIRQLVDQAETVPTSSDVSIFRQQVIPLLKIVTHADIVESASLEEHLAKIVIFLYGPNGQRATKLFERVVNALHYVCKIDLPPSDEEVATFFELSLSTLLKIVEMSGTAAINENLRPHAKEIIDLFHYWLSLGHDLDTALQSLGRVEHRLGIAASLPAAAAPKKPVTSKAAFVNEQAPPGGRHDNDHANISDIHILPTLAEIASPQQEYLPFIDSSRNTLQGIPGLLDRHFRLLREDSVGPLRDAVKDELDRLRGIEVRQEKEHGQHGFHTYTYTNVLIEGLYPHRRSGFSFRVSFDQPARRQWPDERKLWWAYSKRLDPEAVVCLVDSTGFVAFCAVHELSKPKEMMEKVKRKNDKNFETLYSDYSRASVLLTMEDTAESSLKGLVKAFKDDNTFRRLSMIEFPGILLASFEPTLRALQQISDADDLPFADLLVPSTKRDGDHLQLAAPAYSTEPGFRFNLTCLTKDEIALSFKPGDPFELQNLTECTTLDISQASALIRSLSRQLALIQGPPGTGKSYVGVQLIRVLLANKRASVAAKEQGAPIGPILIVCYTNHALDQLLEHLHTTGIEQIIRIGSRSKSQILQKCNLRAIVQSSVEKTKKEKWELSKLHTHQDEVHRQLQQALEDINSARDWKQVKAHLEAHYPLHHQALFPPQIDEEGFQLLSRDVKPNSVLRKWLTSGEAGNQTRPKDELLSLSAWSLSREERMFVFMHWVDEILEAYSDRLYRKVHDHKSVRSGFDSISSAVDHRCLEKANVIGVTCTGLAKNLDTLRKLHSKVLVCEEAGEVLEAHLLTAFLPKLEHIILIGDHQQLRPQINNYDLSRESVDGKKHSLDVSLFERLVSPPPQMGEGVKAVTFSTLETQRRMDPSISELVRKTIYPSLKDSLVVQHYPEVSGMRKRLFWFDHRHQQDPTNAIDADSTSHSNQFEVGMTRALVNHLVAQSRYRPEDIAVLTPYLGQLHLLRQELGKSYAIVLNERDQTNLDQAGLEETNPAETGIPVIPPPPEHSRTTLVKQMRVATVDNFQGEEAKVVVISLVRSNTQKNCGFLRTSNRINVLLSRAQHGMYIIGDSETASYKVQMWADVVEILAKSGNLGPALELCCPRHPDTVIHVASPDDFVRLSPEGGCDRRCADRLLCDHACPQRCHSEVLHNAVHCPKPCPRPMAGCDHPCPNDCGSRCPNDCHVSVRDPTRVLPCGHKKESLPCWQAQNLSTVMCEFPVERLVAGCNHAVTVPCHIDVTEEYYVCSAQCSHSLPCGHICQSKCTSCRTPIGKGSVVKIAHSPCNIAGQRTVPGCGHVVTVPCHVDVTNEYYQCSAKCDAVLSCGHDCKSECSSCRRSIGRGSVMKVVHAPCSEKCGRNYTNCDHKCKSKCHGETDCPPCEEWCLKRCHHSVCGSKCSEPCKPCAICVAGSSKETAHSVKLTAESTNMVATVSIEKGFTESIKAFADSSKNGSGKENSNSTRCGRKHAKCGHICKSKFHGEEECPPCGEWCQERCVHSICGAKCSESCQPCPLCEREASRKAKSKGDVKQENSKQAVSQKENIRPETTKQANGVQEITQWLISRKRSKATIQKPIASENPSHIAVLEELIIHLSTLRNFRPELFEIQKQIIATLLRVERNVEGQLGILSHMSRYTDLLRLRSRVYQTFKGTLPPEATSLVLRMDIAMLSDFFSSLDPAASGTIKIKNLKLNLSKYMTATVNLIKQGRELERPCLQVEGAIYFAQLASLQIADAVGLKAAGQLRTLADLNDARAFCERNVRECGGLTMELESAEEMLRGGMFSSTVTSCMHSVVEVIKRAKEVNGM